MRGSKVPVPMEICRFYIMLALSKEPMHGYAIAEQVLGDSLGSLYFRSSTLSRMLRDLEGRGWVERVPAYFSEGPARITYALTDSGRKYVKAEAGNLWHATGLARRRLP